ncbi:MAG: response regulator [Planctomycetes bacterium]|nr:response regulator [Planctomycetota bacterium]
MLRCRRVIRDTPARLRTEGLKVCNLAKRALRLGAAIAVLVVLVGSPACLGEADKHDIPITVGVLAKRGPERCLEKWGPTADYLSEAIPGYSFAIVPLDYAKVTPAVKRQDIDFILADPFFYVSLEHSYGVSRIVTLKNLRMGKAYTVFGGVIFYRAGRSDIKHLRDFKGKVVMGVEETSLGGWLAQWREIKEAGIDPHRDFADLRFGGTQDAVVYAVGDGKVDAGCIRTDMLERMDREGKIRIEDFAVIHEHGGGESEEGENAHMPFLHSTRSYPEWPFAKLRGTSDDLAEKVAAALMTMPRESPAAKAAMCAGWTIPHNYQPVDECLKYLRVGPYRDYGKATLLDMLRHYWYWLAGVAALGLAGLAVAVHTSRLNRSLSHALEEQEKDLSEREQAKEALRESEEMFRTITAAANDAVIMMDSAGNIRFWNRAAETIFGYPAGEIIGKPLHKTLAPGRYYKDFQRGFAGFMKSGTGAAVGQTVELMALRKDGSEFPSELSLSAVQINGKWNAVGIVRDVTERKRAEEAVRQARDEAEAANRELESAIEKANALAVEASGASTAKSAFLANMSHEIRTPMNGVIGMTGLLLDTELTDEQRDYAETVRSSAEALLEIINDILDFSKIEAEKAELETIDFDLRTTLEGLSDIVAVKAQEKGLEFVCLVDSEVPSLLSGDPGRLRQVLINLVGNAVKFTSQGEVAIWVTLEKEDSKSAVVRFAVSDTGIGIPPEKIESLFEAFSQADATTTRKYGGTGLGLAISKRIVEMMGGRLVAESEEGHGSKFSFAVRFDKQPAGREPVLDIDEDIRGRRILIVDDNETGRLALTGILRSWGCRCEGAPSGEAALEKLRAAVAEGDPFEVAVLDMVMPEMDGKMLGEKIKSDPDLQETVLVMMTGFGKRGDAAALEKIGFSAYMRKPIRQSQLRDCIQAALGRKSQGAKGAGGTLVTRHTLAEAHKSRVRILVAEDIETNRKVALKLLEKLGYRADAVANGREAVEALKTTAYDIVFMDVQMPEMDGFTATRAIRDEASGVLNHDTVVVAMTAHAMKGDREDCLEAGMNDYISKPLRSEALAEVIAKWAFREKPPQEEPSQEKPSQEDSPQESRPPEPAGPEEIAFDRTDLMDRLDGDEEFLREIVAAFIADAPRQIDGLRDALADGDAAEVRRRAHALKGASANISAVWMQRVSLEMEMAGEAGDLEKAAFLLERLSQEFETFKSVAVV